jgi:hypothetical protein
VILANPAKIIQLKPVAPVSFARAASVPTVLQQTLQGTGFGLENNGVTAMLSNPYFAGTAWQQILKRSVPVTRSGTSTASTRSWPSGQKWIAGEAIAGYFRGKRDDRLVGCGPGVKAQVESQLTAANGVWIVYGVHLRLSAEMPGGPWEINMECSPTNIQG